MKFSPAVLDKARRLANAMRATDVLAAPVVGEGGDEALRAALESCVEAVSRVESEQERIRPLIERAESDIERAFRHYQQELVERQLTRAAQTAANRLLLLDSLKSEADYERERARCRDGVAGTLYWFEHYAWGLDPREDSPLKVMPFAPFPFQQEFIRWLEMLVFEKGTSGLVEKARDMGATVCALDWCVKQWLFRPHFSVLLASATEDLVDSKKDPDTLFEKVRFQLRLTPSWMLPAGFNLQRDMPYMNIANEVQGAVFSGQAPTENVGRQRRRTVVVADEFASWPGGGYKQDESLSQTSRSIIKLSSVKGLHNRFA
ncbi:MAG: hypothetical protein M3R15_26970, partial [Acidobacteriota bacterium]|nr:hypothetical protein [Acidobacteriota bacterium]